jgi:hypothetical protein
MALRSQLQVKLNLNPSYSSCKKSAHLYVASIATGSLVAADLLHRTGQSAELANIALLLTPIGQYWPH